MSIESAEEFLDEIAAVIKAKNPPFKTPDAINPKEWADAKATPDCIVENYLYADVGTLIAAGGMGKTTLMLFEVIHIVLGKRLYGLTIFKSGHVVIITSEDTREMLVARLRLITSAMNLDQASIAKVMERVRIYDASGTGLKLTMIRGDVVLPHDAIDQMIETVKTINPVLIVFDPQVSFGIGESRVNDAEQGLIDAARRLRNALNCCVRYVHHTGKQNARDKTIDQYSGRSGTAMPDGCRMVAVLQTLTADEWVNETGIELLPDEIGLRIARPKTSYCPPQLDILVRRTGYQFTHVEQLGTSKNAKLDMATRKVWQLLTDDLKQGIRHTQNSLQALDIGLSRASLRGALNWLIDIDKTVEYRDMPNASKGGAKRYLHPVGAPTAQQPKNDSKNENSHADENPDFCCAAPIGKKHSAHQSANVFPPSPYGTPETDGAPMAHHAHQSIKTDEVDV